MSILFTNQPNVGLGENLLFRGIVNNSNFKLTKKSKGRIFISGRRKGIRHPHLCYIYSAKKETDKRRIFALILIPINKLKVKKYSSMNVIEADQDYEIDNSSFRDKIDLGGSKFLYISIIK